MSDIFKNIPSSVDIDDSSNTSTTDTWSANQTYNAITAVGGASIDDTSNSSTSDVWSCNRSYQDILAHNALTAAHGVGDISALSPNAFTITLPTNANVNALITTHNTATAAHGFGDLTVLKTDYLSGFIATPEDQPYILNLSVPYAGNLASLSINTSTGTITANSMINGVTVNGLSEVSVTSTNQRVLSSNALNSTISVNDVISIVLSSDSSSENLAFSYTIVR